MKLLLVLSMIMMISVSHASELTDCGLELSQADYGALNLAEGIQACK